MNINKKLSEWVSADLITTKQKEQLQAYERNRQKNAALKAMLFLASLCLGLGIVSIIAYNWQQISDAVKLTSYFVLLFIIVGVNIWTLHKQKELLFNTTLFINALWCLAGIGLIAQIYHLSSPNLEALLFWCLITLPLLPLASYKWLPFIWFPTFILSLFDVLMSKQSFADFIDQITSSYPGILETSGFLALAAILILTENRLKPINAAIRWWTYAFVALYVALTDIGDDYIYTSSAANNIYTFVFWIIIAFITFIVCFFNNQKGHKYWSIILSLFTGFMFIGSILPENQTLCEIWSAAFSLSMLCVLANYALKNNQNRLYKFLIAVIALRFFMIYAQVFGSMLTTGTGLIITSILLFAIAYAWNKHQKFLNKRG